MHHDFLYTGTPPLAAGAVFSFVVSAPQTSTTPSCITSNYFDCLQVCTNFCNSTWGKFDIKSWLFIGWCKFGKTHTYKALSWTFLLFELRFCLSCMMKCKFNRHSNKTNTCKMAVDIHDDPPLSWMILLSNSAVRLLRVSLWGGPRQWGKNTDVSTTVPWRNNSNEEDIRCLRYFVNTLYIRVINNNPIIHPFCLIISFKITFIKFKKNKKKQCK